MLSENVEIIFKAILAQNSLNTREAVPHSDEFTRKMESTHGFPPGFTDKCVRLLKDAHKIFIIEIVQEDDDREVEKIEAYIDADMSTVRRLKNIYQKLLQDIYEEENHQRLMAHQIIRELFPKMNLYNNTPMGHIANKAIMLEEYELLLEKDFSQYTESWKEERIAELFEESGEDLEALLGVEKKQEPEPEIVVKKPVNKRAVDSGKGSELSSMASLQSIDKVLRIYGIDFFYRVNLRKYNFDLIRMVIEQKKITSRDDLTLLRKMIQKIRDNADRDPGLTEHLEKLQNLERIISRYMLLRR